ncbi:MAG TPA: diguanylate cyclase [Blastocatellia bacterium]|nr:diguanylate cyclase [Blastocatellia bacterium]
MSKPSNESRASNIFIAIVSAVGLFIFACAMHDVALGDQFNLNWLLLSLVTVVVVGRTDIRLPKTSDTVTLDDACLYISLMLYGVMPSVVLAGINGLACSLKYPNKRRVIPFNVAVMSLSIFVAGVVTNSLFLPEAHAVSGQLLPAAETHTGFARLLLLAQTMALTHYAVNTSLVSIVNALRDRQKLLRTWHQSFLWTSLTYFAGALAACMVVRLLTVISFYAFILSVPVAAITYFTYKVYLNRVRTSMTQAEQMADLHLRTIEALAIAIDVKDETTHEHVRRVQIYATGMAHAFNLPDVEVEALKAGALLHDIGKLAVPDYILNKPTQLTHAEFEKMKVHTTVGAEILERVGFPYPVVPVVRHHHERWDGTGYPDGLRGEELPMTARILAVVDCFDAAREDRQYRKGLTREEAVALIRSGSGTKYDPQVVGVFLEHLPRFEEEIRRQRLTRAGLKTAKANPAPSALQRGENRAAVFEQIRNAHREVITLYDIAQTIGNSLDLRDMFAVFSSRLQDIVSYTTCVLYLQKPDSIELEAAHIAGRHAARFKGQSVMLNSGVTGYVAANRQPMYNCDPQLDFKAAHLNLEDEYHTAMSVPLMKGNDVLGALTLYHAELTAYEGDHLRLLEAVAKLASDAIANALQHEETQAIALSDVLTGLPNARALRQKVEESAARARRFNLPFSILMMDLDGFKAINDTLGHQTGDRVMREVAQLLSRQVRASDFLSRYAGDEFVAILHIDQDGARELVRRLQRTVDHHDFGFREAGVTVGISIGWASFGVDGDTLDELLLAADRAMYNDKLRRKAALTGPAPPEDLEPVVPQVM